MNELWLGTAILLICYSVIITEKVHKTIVAIVGVTAMLAYGQISEAVEVKVRSLCNISHPSDTNVAWECRNIKKGETLESLFIDRWIDVARFNRLDRRHAYPGISIKVPKNLDEIIDFNPLPNEYPSAENDEKFILVDLSEQFLGAYEYGRLVFSLPVATGEKGHETPNGDFGITAFHRNHKSSMYLIENTNKPYPMNYALRFLTIKKRVSYFIHGRDVPGYPASHGCLGLYDEAMQKRYYGYPKSPVLDDAKRLYEWVIGPRIEDGRFHAIKDGPRVEIVGSAP